MEALDKTIGLFYKFAVARGEMDASVRSSSTVSDAQTASGGRFVTSSDEKAAAREAAEIQQEQERIA
jgi:hypothetical protein